MNHLAKLAAATGLCLAVAGIGSSIQVSAADQAPSVKIDMAGYLTVGTTVSGALYENQLPVTVKWHVSTPGSEICEESAQAIDTDGSTLAAFDLHTRSVYPREITFPDFIYNASYDNGDPPPYVHVSVTDCNGATAEDYMNVRSGPREQTAPSVAYSGGWRTGTCTCWSGGSVAESVGAGSTVTFTNKMNGFGLVTDHAHGRGTYDVYVDGRKVKSIDDSAATTTNRIVDFQTHFNQNPYTSHTIQVRVTSGRVDIDLFETLFALYVT